MRAFRACLDNLGLSHLKNLSHIYKDPVFNKVAFTDCRGLTWLSFRATMKSMTCLESYSLSGTKLGLVPLTQGSCPHPSYTPPSPLPVGSGAEHLPSGHDLLARASMWFASPWPSIPASWIPGLPHLLIVGLFV